jgi:hypothetical protein
MSSGTISASAIAGFASIDYRLSADPDTSEDPGTPAFKLRCARHPDHLRDLWSALECLHREYTVDGRYIMIGHSVGATLIFQLLMGSLALCGHVPPAVPLPAAVVGNAGIYEFVDFAARHGQYYADFIEAALGKDKSKWNSVAPACARVNYSEVWPSGKLVLLSWSSEDSLVDRTEIDRMTERLSGSGLALKRMDILGDHDDAWRRGTEIARLISTVLNSQELRGVHPEQSMS